jgi:hypothetical protein
MEDRKSSIRTYDIETYDEVFIIYQYDFILLVIFNYINFIIRFIVVFMSLINLRIIIE